MELVLDSVQFCWLLGDVRPVSLELSAPTHQYHILYWSSFQGLSTTSRDRADPEFCSFLVAVWQGLVDLTRDQLLLMSSKSRTSFSSKSGVQHREMELPSVLMAIR